ncbi:MAG: hypothetical protein RLT05_36250 [Bauldia litoralis]
MLRVPVLSAIALTRLAALIVVGFCIYVLLAPDVVLGQGDPFGSGVQKALRTGLAMAAVVAVGIAALYAVFRHGRHNASRYLAFVTLLTPAFLFLPTLTRSPEWYISLIIMGVLFLAAISCLLPNPVQAWNTFEPQRR